MSDWDWNSITVVYGEWWLALFAIILFILGYFWGVHAENKRWIHRWERDWPENDPLQP